MVVTAFSETIEDQRNTTCTKVRTSYVPVTSARFAKQPRAEDIDNFRGCKTQRHDTSANKGTTTKHITIRTCFNSGRMKKRDNQSCWNFLECMKSHLF